MLISSPFLLHVYSTITCVVHVLQAANNGNRSSKSRGAGDQVIGVYSAEQDDICTAGAPNGEALHSNALDFSRVPCVVWAVGAIRHNNKPSQVRTVQGKYLLDT